jgi:hypothetical protein
MTASNPLQVRVSTPLLPHFRQLVFQVLNGLYQSGLAFLTLLDLFFVGFGMQRLSRIFRMLSRQPSLQRTTTRVQLATGRVDHRLFGRRKSVRPIFVK